MAAIDGATSEVRTLLGTIQQEVDVLGSSWRAQSNVAFTRVHLRWAERAAVINNALRIMQEKQWEQAAADLATMLGTIVAGLNNTNTDYLGVQNRIVEAFS